MREKTRAGYGEDDSPQRARFIAETKARIAEIGIERWMRERAAEREQARLLLMQRAREDAERLKREEIRGGDMLP